MSFSIETEERHIDCRCCCGQRIFRDGDDLVVMLPITKEFVAFVKELERLGVTELERRISL